MKTLLFLAASTLSFSASAASVTVMPNVLMASGPATQNYFLNLKKISTEFSAVSNSQLGTLASNGASVDINTGDITYFFHKLESSDAVETCWSQLSFKTTASSEGPVVSDVKAQLSCSKNQD